MAFVLSTLIIKPFPLQKLSNAFNIHYKLYAFGDIRTASSAKANMKIDKVASSNITLFSGAILLSSKYSYRNVYT
jgi:hypothetical protein